MPLQKLSRRPWPLNRWVLALLALAATGSAWSAESAGQIKKMSGDVSVVRAKQAIAATPGFSLEARDRIITGKDGSVGLTTTDNTLVSLGPNSQMVIDQYAFNQQTQEGNIGIRFLSTFAAISGLLAKASPDKAKFSTPTATISIRGTEFIVRIEVPPELEAEVLGEDGGVK